MRRAAMLEQKDPLPDAELKPAIGDWDRQLNLGQGALDMGRHVVGPFVIVAVERAILRHDPPQKRSKVAPNVGRCILLDQQ